MRRDIIPPVINSIMTNWFIAASSLFPLTAWRRLHSLTANLLQLRPKPCKWSKRVDRIHNRPTGCTSSSSPSGPTPSMQSTLRPGLADPALAVMERALGLLMRTRPICLDSTATVFAVTAWDQRRGVIVLGYDPATVQPTESADLWLLMLMQTGEPTAKTSMSPSADTTMRSPPYQCTRATMRSTCHLIPSCWITCKTSRSISPRWQQPLKGTPEPESRSGRGQRLWYMTTATMMPMARVRVILWSTTDTSASTVGTQNQ